jgi:hypothetical protein
MKRVQWSVLLLLAGYASVNPAHAQERFGLFRRLADRGDAQPGTVVVMPATTQTAPPPLAAKPSSYAPVPDGTAAAQPSTLPAAMSTENPTATANQGTSLSPEVGLCKVNSKHLVFNYEVKNVGPSGIAGVEVWYTRDGQAWQKSPTGVQRENPYYVDVQEEGNYGFILVARTGLGGGRDAPEGGDPAQIWVEVDTTKPVVFLTGVEPGNGGRTLTIRWTATDKNLSRRPIALFYADQSGNWLPITAGLENSGTFTWPIPPSIPSSFRVKVEATDLAGNVGSAETPSPVLIDLTQPAVANIRVSTTDK